jgi:hypothetical protein
MLPAKYAVLFPPDLWPELWQGLDRSTVALRQLNKAMRRQVDGSITRVASRSSGVSAAKLTRALPPHQDGHATQRAAQDQVEDLQLICRWCRVAAGVALLLLVPSTLYVQLLGPRQSSAAAV